jgi:hypothetical protein
MGCLSPGKVLLFRFFVTLLWCLLGGLFVYTLLHFWPTTDDSNIFIKDEILGYRLRPLFSGKDFKMPELQARYNIGVDGTRVVPGAQEQNPVIAFLGGSFTFGHGVEDGEAYPAVFQRSMTDYQVLNYGAPAYGTTQSYLLLTELLESSKDLRLVVYGFIYGHVIRNYKRRLFLEVIGVDRLPLFEFEGDELQFKGTWRIDDGLAQDDQDLPVMEWRVTAELIKASMRLCSDSGIPFVVLILGKYENCPISDMLSISEGHVLRTFDQNSIPYIDLAARVHQVAAERGLDMNSLYFPDFHPLPQWYEIAGTELPGLLARFLHASKLSTQN